MPVSRRVAELLRRLLPQSVLEALTGGPPAEPAPRFITQDEYAALLNRDRERMAQAFEWSTGAGMWHCRTCHRRAELVSVFHPIWDGPFDEGGSGVVDRRDIPWCLHCEGPPPSMNGQPIRLPYLDQLPVRLRMELFERAAFHRLPVKVERFREPAVFLAVPVDPNEQGRYLAAEIDRMQVRARLEAKGARDDAAAFAPHAFVEDVPGTLTHAASCCARCGLPSDHPIHQ